MGNFKKGDTFACITHPGKVFKFIRYHTEEGSTERRCITKNPYATSKEDEFLGLLESACRPVNQKRTELDELREWKATEQQASIKASLNILEALPHTEAHGIVDGTAAMRDEIKRLRDILRPFAALAVAHNSLGNPAPKSGAIYSIHGKTTAELTVEHLNAARDAL